MVFSCLNCGARYRIAEDRLSGKVLRFVCRKCDAAHLLKDPSLGGQTIALVDTRDEAARRTAGAARPPQGHPARSGGRPPVSAPPSLTTPVEPASRPPREDTWFAIKRGQRLGPFLSSDLLRLLSEGTLHERSFVWRPTMSAWTRLIEVPELAEVLRQFRANSHQPPPLPPEARTTSETRKDPWHEQTAPFFPGAAPSVLEQDAHEQTAGFFPDALPGAHMDPDDTDPMPFQDGDVDLFAPMQPDLAETAEEVRFFDDPKPMLPQARQEPAVVPPPPETAQELDTSSQTAIPDFSVLMRIGQNTRRRLFIWLGLAGVALVVLVLVFLFLFARHDPSNVLAGGESEPSVGEAALPTQRQEVPETPEQRMAREREIEARRQEDAARFRLPSVGAPRAAAVETPVAPSSPTAAVMRNPPSVGTLDRGTQEDFARYGKLLDTGTVKRDDVSMEVKPKVLTDMPKQDLASKGGMDQFMSGKLRKFADCKARMTKPTDLPVKVGLSFDIDEQGRVGGIVVDQQGGSRDEGLDRCVRHIVGSWAFPSSGESIRYKTTLML